MLRGRGRGCKARMNIPVFHDDQHGTAIIVAAAVLNALELAGKKHRRGQDRRPPAPAPRRSPASTCWSRSAPGARTSGSPIIEGVVYKGRDDADGPLEGASMRRRPTSARSAEVIDGADIFLGLSAAGVLKPEMVKRMATRAADPGARQSDAGDHAGGGARGAARRDDLHRPLGLSRTRSTTSCAFPTSSAARSMSARPPSTRR